MKITLLDAATLGQDLAYDAFKRFGEVEVWQNTSPAEVAGRIRDSEIVIINKVKLHEDNLRDAAKLRLICITATGYDGIDVAYCRKAGIAVCNVVGYSTHSVAQVTVSLVLTLANHLAEYRDFVSGGAYTAGGVANRITPVFHELYGKTWGLIGLGNIGKQVAAVASAFGCRVMAYKRTPEAGYCCVDIDTLCREADILTVHCPLNEGTRGLLDERRLGLLKPNCILVNTARGAVTDEAAVAEAVLQGRIAAFGTDVYTTEPLAADHPFQKIVGKSNVCVTPHMAWAAYEARVRCMQEIEENIDSFLTGGHRNRVD